jgi:hypothetical protein
LDQISELVEMCDDCIRGGEYSKLVSSIHTCTLPVRFPVGRRAMHPAVRAAIVLSVLGDDGLDEELLYVVLGY